MDNTKQSTWELYRCSALEKQYRCSNCGRTVTQFNRYFTSNGKYDLKSEAKQLLIDFPYCHCGEKMRVDKNIKTKLKTMKI